MTKPAVPPKRAATHGRPSSRRLSAPAKRAAAHDRSSNRQLSTSERIFLRYLIQEGYSRGEAEELVRISAG